MYKKYSPKENLAFIIVASENSIFKEFNVLIKQLETLLEKNKNTDEILDKIDNELITKIKNYWQLEKSQVIAYGYLVFNQFKVSKEKMTAENITTAYIYQMRLYSPDNAVEFVQRNFNVDLKKIYKE